MGGRTKILAAGLAAALAWGLPVSAEASGSAAKHGESAKPAEAEGHGEDAKPARLDPKCVDIPALVAPLVAKGKLAAYAFVGIRLQTKSPSEAEKVKADLPLVQDAVTRAFHAHPLDVTAKEDELRARLTALVSEAVAAALGPNRVEAVILRDVVRTEV